jgi:hypothetical protein
MPICRAWRWASSDTALRHMAVATGALVLDHTVGVGGQSPPGGSLISSAPTQHFPRVGAFLAGAARDGDGADGLHAGVADPT